MRRLQILFVLFIFAILAIISKLLYIQVFTPDIYTSHNYLQTERIIPERGEILDRNSDPLVVNMASYTLFAEPPLITDKHKLIENIDKVLKIGEATLEARLKMDRGWVPLSQDVEENQKKALEKLKLEGIGFEGHSKRYYPEASIAAHLLGFVGKDQDGDSVGYFGIEGYYNKDLEGLPGILKTERDILGKPIVIGTQDKLKGEDGRDMILTIDKSTQNIVKEAIEGAVEYYKAKSGCITVADPQTMEILAMHCTPDFDPTKYNEFSETYYKNPIISDVFEPGSIFKPFIVAAALNEDKIKPSDTYNEKGAIKMGEYYIRTWDDKYHGVVTMSEILQNSSNVGMVHIGSKLGDDNIREYLEKYGFGEKTGIDLQGEVTSSIKSEKNWYPIDYATVTFGQGIAVTQIQIITAFSSLVNDGWIMRPYIVKKMISENGDVKEIRPKRVRRILTTRTSKLIKEMMKKTVKHGEVKWKVPKGYEIGGKTGTAQIALKGSYDPSKTNASFIGFTPMEKPRFVVLVTLHQPAASQWASETAAPVFFDVIEDILVRYNIFPE